MSHPQRGTPLPLTGNTVSVCHRTSHVPLACPSPTSNSAFNKHDSKPSCDESHALWSEGKILVATFHFIREPTRSLWHDPWIYTNLCARCRSEGEIVCSSKGLEGGTFPLVCLFTCFYLFNLFEHGYMLVVNFGRSFLKGCLLTANLAWSTAAVQSTVCLFVSLLTQNSLFRAIKSQSPVPSGVSQPLATPPKISRFVECCCPLRLYNIFEISFLGPIS